MTPFLRPFLFGTNFCAFIIDLAKSNHLTPRCACTARGIYMKKSVGTGMKVQACKNRFSAKSAGSFYLQINQALAGSLSVGRGT